MNRFYFLAALLLITTGCDSSLGLPTDGEAWTHGVDADEAADAVAAGAEQDAPADEASDPGDDGDDADDFVPPFPVDGDDEAAPVCMLGDWMAGWADDPGMHVGDFEHVTNPADLTDLEIDQLEVGFERWGFFDFHGADEFFGMLEGGRVLTRDAEVTDLDRSFTHHRFHFRGMEFGFVFVAGTDRPVAAVVEGEIIDCSVTL